MTVEEKYRNDPAVALAYVDGSFDKDTFRYASGIVFLYKGEQKKVSFAEKNLILAGMRNVAGEIRAAETAMEMAVFSGAKKVVICYDYAGIEKWAKGQWRTNKEGTIRYKERCDLFSELIDIDFVKIKAHTGDPYNEMADRLANGALWPIAG
jgi:ribonuclease HI